MDIKGMVITSSADIGEFCRVTIGAERREHFLVIGRDASGRVLGHEIVAVGSIDQCAVDPREIFRFALLTDSTALFVAHNHPSGNVEPSPDDRHLTEQLVKAGCLVRVTILDHVIVGRGVQTYFSFAEHGLLTKGIKRTRKAAEL